MAPIETCIEDQDILDFLEDLQYIGQLHPVSRDNKRPPIIALLVPVEIALEEINEKFGDGIDPPLREGLIPNMSRDQLISFLEENGINVYVRTDQFVKDKEDHNKMDKDSSQFDRAWERYISASRKASTVAMAA